MSTTKRILVNATHADELRIAVVENGKLTDLDIERPGLEQKKANIYKGTISSIEPSLEAVFINYGSDRHGFLPFKEISPEYYLKSVEDGAPRPKIQELVKLGQEVVVQIEKEERGNKGAALTTYISLAGSYLVLMPNNPKAGGISRRVEGSEREQLRAVLNDIDAPEDIGVIARTAALGRSKKELAWDLSVLLGYWQAIKQAAIAKPGPYLIHQESDAVIRTVRDYLREDVNELLIDNKKLYERAQQYIHQVKPDFLPRLHLYSGSLPLFNFHRIEQQIETAYHREVRLPSGGSIVIDRTEALVAIDINSAKATKGKGIEETALAINLEAAEEIGRQLRLRDLGGLIVIDFIDMINTQHKRQVAEHLRKAIANDRARIQLGPISRFGLLEMSRQRLRDPLNKANQTPCPRCQGQGHIRSVESIALSLIRLIQEQASADKHLHFQIQAPINVATYLTNEKRHVLEELELSYSSRITIIPNQHLETPNYHLKRTKDEHLGTQLEKKITSYRLIRQAKPQDHNITPHTRKSIEEPLIKDFLPKEPIAAPRTTGLIKQLWDKMFGAPAESNQAKEGQKEKSNKQRQHPPKHWANKNPPGKRHSPQGNRKRPHSGGKSGAQQNRPARPATQPTAKTATNRPNQPTRPSTQQQPTRTSTQQQPTSKPSQPTRTSTQQQPTRTSTQQQPTRTSTQQQPASKPSQPTRPSTQQQPASKPSQPARPSTQQQPASKPSQPTRPSTQQQPASKPSQPARPSTQQQPASKPSQPARPSTQQQPASKPSQPARPSTQQQPASKPSQPARPSTQQQPASKPSQPARPSTQQQPASKPSQPARPSTQQQPASKPSQPARPSTQQQPASKPSQPARPSTQQQPASKPSQPARPSTQQQPASKPSQPARPSTQQQPASKPSQPARPSTQQQPASKPSQPARPSTQQQPTSKPSQPAKSSETTTSRHDSEKKEDKKDQ